MNIFLKKTIGLIVLFYFGTSISSCSISEKKSTLPEEKQITHQEPVLLDNKSEKAQSETDHSTQAGLTQLEQKNNTLKNETQSPNWSYEGVLGPELWGDLSPEYTLCKTGDAQSPVNLTWSKPHKGRTLEFHYQSSPLKLIDNGHTIQFNVDEGNYIVVGNERYDLQYGEFHSPSEHTLSGKKRDMEMQLVHKSKSGNTLIISRFLEVGDKRHTFISTIWNHFPSEKFKEMEVPGKTIELNSIIPTQKTYYNYSGSLTTPPCTQSVDWNVLNTPIIMTKAQLQAFQALYPNNSRPIQNLNGRKPINY